MCQTHGHGTLILLLVNAGKSIPVLQTGTCKSMLRVKGEARTAVLSSRSHEKRPASLLKWRSEQRSRE
jgi:hypothetical protein